MKYMIERLGDISGKTFHATPEDAFSQLEKEYPKLRQTPDPEDDRILIWGIPDKGRAKVIWHFSGWHWDFDCSDLVEGGLPQGKLPNDIESLYKQAFD